MKGVILAGGLGTRLYPLTLATNKHLLPVYDKPMVVRPIETLVKAGIKEILIVTVGPHALKLAEDFADNGSIAVILGDNCTDADISKDVKNFKEGALVFFRQVENPQRFGVAEFDKKGNIVKIIEKPKNPPSNMAQTGLYLYDHTVFNKIRTLGKSARGELEVTDLNNIYLKEGNLHWSELQGFWNDAGTFESLFEVSEYWAKRKIKK